MGKGAEPAPPTQTDQTKEPPVKDRLFEALKKSTADYADVRVETEDRMSIVCRGEEVDKVSANRFTGGIVRAMTRAVVSRR